MTAPSPSVSAIIIHFGSTEYTEHLVDRLLALCATHIGEIIIVDNGTGAELALPGSSEIRVMRLPKNRGYAAACNAGMRVARLQRFLILNNDIDFSSDWLGPLVAEMDGDASIGICAPKLLHRNGRFQLSWGDDPGILAEFQERKRQQQSRLGGGPDYARRAAESSLPRDVDWVTGAVMLASREACDAVHGFDDAYFFYFEDSDLCRRVRQAGFRIRYQPEASLVHYGGGSEPERFSVTRDAYRAGQLRYYSRFNGRISFLTLKLYLSAITIFRALNSPELRIHLRMRLTSIWTVTHAGMQQDSSADPDS